MSTFNKVIAKLGIGSATVDTKVGKTYVQQGEHLDGVVEVRGGSTDQRIDAIDLKLMVMYGHEGRDRLTPGVVANHRVHDSFTISKGEKKQIPFSFKIPLHTPVTMVDPETQRNVPSVWIETGADIPYALDPKDKDPITIDPSPVHETLIDAIKVIGFAFKQMECQNTPAWVKAPRSFVQQYEFAPTHGPYHRKLDELEVYILHADEETTVYFEIDKRSRGSLASLKERLNLDEHRGRVTFSHADILSNRRQISDTFTGIIDKIL